MKEITQAFVLAAGLGKRLRPLTDELAKPLIPIFQKPLITFALDHLIGAGVSRFVVNTHRLPELFQDFFSENSYSGKSITLVHEQDLLEIGGVVLDDGHWFNIGSRSEYLEVHRVISQEGWKPGYVKASEWPQAVAKTAIVDPSAELRGCSVVGEHCRVGANAILEDTILWSDAEIASQSQLQGCIVRSKKKASGSHRNIDI